MQPRKIFGFVAVLLALLLPTLAGAQTPPDLKYSLPGHNGGVNDVAVAPNGKIFATAASDGTIKLWNVSDGTLAHTLVDPASPYAVRKIVFTKDSQTLIAAETYSRIVIWNLVDDSITKIIATGDVYSVALSPDAKTIAAACNDKNIYLYSFPDGAYLSTLSGHTGAVYDVSFSPTDPNVLASGSADKNVLVWNVSAQTYVTLSGHTNVVDTVLFSPKLLNSKPLIASGGNDSTVRLWQQDSHGNWTSVNALTGATSYIYRLAFTTDGKTVAAAGVYDNYVRLWTVANGAPLTPINTNQYAYAVGILTNNKTVISGGSNGLVAGWKLTGATPLTTYTDWWSATIDNIIIPPPDAPNQNEYMSVNAGYIRRHKLADGSVFDGFSGSSPMCYSHDGKLVFYNYGSWNVRRLSSNQVIHTIPASVYTAVFQPGDKNLAIWHPDVLEIWRISDGSLLKSFPTQGNYNWAFSGDGSKLFLSNGYTSTNVYNVADGTLLQTITDTGNSEGYGISPSFDGSVVATWGPNQNIVVWDVVSGTAINRYTPRPSLSWRTMALSPFGDVLTTYNSDNTVNVFQVYQNVSQFYDSEIGTGLNVIRYSPDASLIFLCRNDATVLAAQNPYPVSLGVLSVAPQQVQGSVDSATGTITLSLPATGTGVGVSLSSSDPTIASVPSSVMIATGDNSAVFPITTYAVKDYSTVTIYATYGGAVRTATLVVEPAIPVKAIKLTPTSLVGGYASIAVLTLTDAACNGGIVVPLTSSDPGVQVPKYVTVPPCKKSVSFLVRTSGVTKSKTVTISGTHGGVTKSATITLKPVTIASLDIIPDTVSGTDDAIGIVTLSVPAPINTTVTLTTANSKVAAPDVKTFIIPAGQTMGMFSITTAKVAANTPVQFKATVNGTSKTATITVTP